MVEGEWIKNQTTQTQNLFDLTISGNTAGVGQLVSSGTLTLAGGNNITLSQAGNHITISGGAGAAFDGGVSSFANSAGTTGTVNNEIVFVGGTNITLSQSINANSATITVIGGAGGAVTGISGIGASNTTYTSGTVIFVGSDIVTVKSGVGQSVIIDATTSQSVQTQNLIDLQISGNTTGTTALVSSGTLTLAGGNNITLSQSGTNAITISAANQTVQTQNLFDLTISGNTAGTGVLLSSGTLSLAGGNNITLSQNGNAITISGPTMPMGIGASNTTFTSGTVVFIGSDIVTVKSGAQSVIIDVTQSVQTQNLIDVTISGNTAGTGALVSSGTLSLAGGNNITLSQSGTNAITISAANQTTQTQNLIDVTLSGNTSGTLALVSSGTLTLAGGNNITLSQAGNAVTISAFNQSVQTQNLIDVTISGNTSGTSALVSSGTLTLAGGNNITLSQVGNAITISGAGASAGIAGLANSQATFTSGTVNLLEGGGAITIASGAQSFKFSVPASSSLVASGGISFSTSGSTVTISSPVFTISGNTSGTSALISSGTLTLAGGNNVTLSQNGNAITISAFNQSTQTQNLIDLTISGNTSGTSALVSSGTLTLAGGNNITLSQAGNAVTISAFNQSVQTQSTHVHIISGNTSGTTASMSTGTIVLAGGNNITLSQNANTVTVSAFNQSAQTGISGIAGSGASTATSGTVQFQNSNGITFGLNGNTITASHNAVTSQSVQTQNIISIMSFYENPIINNANIQIFNGYNSINRAVIPSNMNATQQAIIFNFGSTASFSHTIGIYSVETAGSIADLLSSFSYTQTITSNPIWFRINGFTWNITPGDYAVVNRVSANVTNGSMYGYDFFFDAGNSLPTFIYRGYYSNAGTFPSTINASEVTLYRVPYLILAGT